MRIIVLRTKHFWREFKEMISLANKATIRLNSFDLLFIKYADSLKYNYFLYLVHQ